MPNALNGKTGILVIGFSHASQSQVKDWGKKLAAEYGTSDRVGYFEIAMLAGAPKMLRGMIINKMKSSIPETERPHFLPLTEDEAAWRTVAHYDKSGDAYVLLLDRSGTVRWQTEGNAIDPAFSNLKKHIQDLLADSPR